MISFWARGSPGSQVITQGSEEDPTIIDSSRSNGAAGRHPATVFKLVSLSREEEDLDIVHTVGFVKHQHRDFEK